MECDTNAVRHPTSASTLTNSGMDTEAIIAILVAAVTSLKCDHLDGRALEARWMMTTSNAPRIRRPPRRPSTPQLEPKRTASTSVKRQKRASPLFPFWASGRHW